MTSHSKYSASGAHRWIACPGSMVLSKLAPPTGSSLAADRGTAAHTVAAAYLQGFKGGDSTPVNCEGEEVQVGDTTIVLDEDLAKQVEVYVEHVRSLGGIRLVEVQSNYAATLGLEEAEAWGTADTVVIRDSTLYVIDLKTGRHWVSAQANPQLLLYGMGVAEALKAAGLWEDFDKIVLTIVQPAVKDAPEQWELTLEEFEAHCTKLAEAAQRAEEAAFNFVAVEDEEWCDVYLSPAEEACRYCPAAAFCPALARLSEGADTPPEFLELDKHALNEAMRRIPLIEVWIEAVQAEAYRRASKGDTDLAFKLVLGRQGNRKWADEEKAREELALKIPLTKLVTEPKLKSPAQVEKLLPKGMTLDEDLVVRAPAKPTLVPADDPRAAWVEGDIADEFEVVR